MNEIKIITDKISKDELYEKIIHKDLAQGKWFQMTVMEQLGNIGSKIELLLNGIVAQVGK